MPRAIKKQNAVNSSFVSSLAIEDTAIDELQVPSWGRTMPLKTDHEDPRNDMPSTSQSWPPVYGTSARSSFGLASEELDLGDALDECEHSNPPAESLSPAALFLSSFCPASSSSGSSNQTIPGYVLGDTIGYGGFSTIKEATSSSGGVVAVKIVQHSAFDNLIPDERSRQRSRLSHEARVWVSLSHENILPLFDYHQTFDATYLITLYCPAGSLLDILKREGTPALEQTDAGCMFRQVVKGIQYLHESVGLVHGDIKLENVLVDESGVCRLADFGLSRLIGGDSSQVSSAAEEEYDEEPSPKSSHDRSRVRRAGTSALPVHLSLIRHGPQRHRHSSALPASATPPTHPDHMFQPGSLPYAAPELLLPHARSEDAGHGRRSRPTAHPAQDMWALGVMLYALLTGMLPFRDGFEPRLQMKILRGTYDIPPAIGPLAESVLKGCLERDVSERWTIAMVDDAAWGIGYGNVDLDPVIREEQRSQSHSRTRTPLRESPPACNDLDLSASMSACSLASSAPVNTPRLRGRPPRVEIRSRSRSPSPSVAPRTPDDDGSDQADYFGRRRRRQESGEVQIVLEDEDAEWESIYSEERGDSDSGAAALPIPLSGGKLERAEGVRGRQGTTGFKEGQPKSGSRTRGWSMNELMR